MLDQKEFYLKNLEARLKSLEEELILQNYQKTIDKENNISKDVTMYASPGLLAGMERKMSNIMLESPISAKYSIQTPAMPKNGLSKGRIFELQQNIKN